MAQNLTGQEFDKYLIGAYIGGGAMGQVYQAYPNDGSSPVAIKVMLSEIAKEHDLQQRFVREVRQMERLNHENIVPILDHGLYNGTLFFTMKLITGPTLRKLMERQEFTPAQVWKILEPLANALSYIHGEGIVHRDIKPGNVFLERLNEGFHVYLGDFGLSKKPGADETLTVAGGSVGTVEYMALEAVLGEKLDQRADLYSLAVVTYELLLGVLPVEIRSDKLSSLSKVMAPVRAPLSLNPDFPPALEAVLLRGLGRFPDDRYSSAEGFATDYFEAVKALSPEQRKTVYRVG